MVVIAFSGLPGTGSSTAAKLLAQKLGLDYFSVGAYNKRHAKHIEKETEKAVAMWKMDKKELKKFHLASDDISRERAKKGNIVIDGKLAIRMLRGLSDFSVWIKAPAGVRAKRITGRDKIPMDKAMKILKEKQKLEVENWKRIYGFNYLDQEKEADLVIDTSDKKPDEIVKSIINKLRARGLME